MGRRSQSIMQYYHILGVKKSYHFKTGQITVVSKILKGLSKSAVLATKLARMTSNTSGWIQSVSTRPVVQSFQKRLILCTIGTANHPNVTHTWRMFWITIAKKTRTYLKNI